MNRLCLSLGGLGFITFMFMALSVPELTFCRVSHHGAHKSTSCSAHSRRPTAGCPCTSSGPKCRGTGLQCLSNICSCGPSFVDVTTGPGVTRCLKKFYAEATIETGVSRACNASVNDPLHGLKIKFTNAVLPVSCTDETFGVVNYAATNPTDAADDTNYNTYVFIDPNTGDVLGNSCDDCSPPDVYNNAAGVGNTIVQQYGGYCIDSRGMPSNNFFFKVVWGHCE